MTQFRSHKAVQEYLANRGRITLLFSGVVVAVSILLFFYIWQYTKMVEIQIAIRAIRKQHTRLNEVLEGMLVERAKLTAMARIEALARDQLGMIPPSAENVQFLSSRGMVVAPRDRPVDPVPVAPPPGPGDPTARPAPGVRGSSAMPGDEGLSENQMDDAMYNY
ncbi:MAG: cell division protein FtsL [Candidatus Wallbacteria bacterium]|nr:cell division protein FtsL [Candidatus Wallbacteria bacterium]MBI4866822.1 cell division protein FtsL [Candidatus Wallbacteria bacterium]